MSFDKFQPVSLASTEEIQAYNDLLGMSKQSPIPDNEKLANLGLFWTRASFARMQFIHNLYLKAIPTHGVIMEFGVRWGHNMALFTTFRNVYEPYNTSRKIVGFDTFEGFLQTSKEDGASDDVFIGAYSVTDRYFDYISHLLQVQEKLGPRSHVKKHELIKGDVIETLPRYLEKHTETIISLAYFDLDIYAPTKKCLEIIRPYLAKNSIIGFDELGYENFPGETQALREAWGISSFQIKHDPISPQQSYLVFEE